MVGATVKDGLTSAPATGLAKPSEKGKTEGQARSAFASLKRFPVLPREDLGTLSTKMTTFARARPRSTCNSNVSERPMRVASGVGSTTLTVSFPSEARLHTRC